MAIQDRTVELRRVPASDLHPHPKNWRRHPKAQQDALRAMLDRVGFVGAVIARETPDGLMLIDGHLRADLTLVWKKPSFAISRGHYHWQHELCWYAVRKGATAQWVGDRSQSTVWEIPWDKFDLFVKTPRQPGARWG